ncbi:MAG TPA: hypothetical protein VJY41_12990 [Prolixibacteraceae bacterium]|nr:hypothetical protein [Prolixibacteraceae bacterium]
MGIIQKQTIKGSTWSYVGAFVGFVNTGLLFPKIFSTSEIGLLSVIVAISALFSQFSSLGMNSVTARLFPYFKSSNNDKYGFLTLLLLVTAIGFAVSMLIGYVFKDWIIETKGDNSGLLGQYAFYLIPMTLFTLFFNALDVYNKMLYDISSGIFLKEFLLRILNFIAILLFFFGWIDFNIFVFLYVISFFVPFAGLFIILLSRGEIVLKIRGLSLTRQMKREIIMVAAFGILAGFSTVIGDYLDKYLVNKYLGLSDTGIYTIAFFIGTMILLPSRALNKISSTLIAESWKNNDLKTIKDIYTKSSINQFVFGLLLFILIISNLHNIFAFLPPEYINGKWVLIIIGITNLVIMLSGVSFSIISTSKYYWYMSALMGVQILLIITTNILLIPIMGMTGAAIATVVSVTAIRFGSIILIGIKSKIWPFSVKHLTAIVISIFSVFIIHFVPKISNIYFDGILRGGITTLFFAFAIIKFKLSNELNEYYKTFITSIIKKSKKTK